jgi:uncharacterized ParB-like nuclease family protein
LHHAWPGDYGITAAIIEKKRHPFSGNSPTQNRMRSPAQRTLALSSVYSLLGKVGGVLKVPRKTHAKKDAAAAESFKATLAEKLAALSAEAEGRPATLAVGGAHRFRGGERRGGPASTHTPLHPDP